MKIAVLTDIHANFPALSAVAQDIDAWQPDHVVVGGDIVNRGPHPLECLDYVLERVCTDDWRLVRGNHEDLLLKHHKHSAPPSTPLEQFTHWTQLRLQHRIAALEAMPFQQAFFSPDELEARVVHASMRGNRDGIYPETSDRKLRELISPTPALLCVGHTHRPLIRSLNGALIVNAGSCGLPFDLDERPAYARLTWQPGSGWQAGIARVEYDRSATENDFSRSGYLEQAGPMAALALMELRSACSLIYGWVVRYQSAVESGALDGMQSVDKYLSELGLS